MGEPFSRRAVLGGMALEAASLLFSRSVGATEVLGSAQGVLAVGNTHLLTVVAVSEKTLRLRVIQQGKQGPAEEVGIVPRDWPEPLTVDGSGVASWGGFKVHLEERPWQMTIVDDAGKTRQQIRLEPSTGAIHFLSGEGPLFGLGEGGHPLNHRGMKDMMANGQHSPDLATFGARSPIPWLLSTEG